ncbi:MAG: TDP-N-acetylfucosamine:lipid II N-acetylfucosaminyltransferase [Bacteroidales bacterium]|nr:TDP-N-acetylfucosamine:lipid II N-acetylfucosaminyltransferase [Bacteroidales bacterium]
MISILHIVPDDKFIDFVIDDFARHSGIKNEFVLFSASPGYKPLHIKRTNEIKIVETNSEEYLKIYANTQSHIVIYHSLTHPFIINDLKTKPIIYWITWGHDYQPIIKQNLLKPKTIELYQVVHKTTFKEPLAYKKKNTILKNNFTRTLHRLLRNTLKKPNGQNYRQQLEKVYKRIDYCSTVVPHEYSFFNKIPGFRARHLSYKIGFVNNPFSSYNNRFETLGEAILVGNSYTYTNNHPDVFYQLKNLNISNVIIVPLSYGLNPSEHPELIDLGKSMFGDRFQPVLDFVSFEAYNAMLKKSKVAIFNHIRQQAVGNILIMLWQGSKVFLSELSPVYKYMKEQGVFIYSVENDLTAENIETALTQAQKQTNRKYVFSTYSEKAIETTNNHSLRVLARKAKQRLIYKKITGTFNYR